MTTGERIRTRRESLGMSQVDLAAAVYESKQTIYKYECDIVTNIPIVKLELIAKALQTTPSTLMGWEQLQEGPALRGGVSMIADRIKELRTLHQMTQKDLGAILSLSQQAVAKWERGIAEPDTEAIARLADHFHVSTDYLLGRPEKKKASPSEDELAELLQEPLMGEIYKAALQLSPQHRKMVLAQIQAVQEIEDNIEKKDAR